jgi:MATE family multidrug resistance protein
MVLVLFQYTANYATTFVAQYLGAGRQERIGSAVWQAFYFSVLAGVAFLGLIPLAEPIFTLAGHAPAVRDLEIIYFKVLCFTALPMLVTASANSFFAGRGETWTVLLVDAFGMTINIILAYALIFGRLGFAPLGIAGAGWATVGGTSASAALALILFLRPRYRARFGTLAGWRPDLRLLGRLLCFGLPSGLHVMFDVLAFTAFLFLVGRLGEAELAATNIAFTINMVAFLPMLGLSQAVGVLVGQRLGQNRPAVAERTTWTGFRLCWLYMAGVAVLYVLTPGAFLFLFENDHEPETWARVARLVPVLLRFVAVYSLFDSVNLVFSFALRGAGDTRFVMMVSLVLSWPLMVLPTWAVVQGGWGLYWAWGCASAYIIGQALIFLFRFRVGKWKTMRVIEAAPDADIPHAPTHRNGELASRRVEQRITAANGEDGPFSHSPVSLASIDDTRQTVDE